MIKKFINNNIELIKEIIRFLIIGGIATICDYIIYFLFYNLILTNIDHKTNIFISTILGFLTGMLVNWFLQPFVYKNITNDQKKSKKVFLKFFLISVLGLLITEVGMLLGNGLYKTLYIFNIDFWSLFFKVMMTCIVLIFNYLMRKFYVFKNKIN